MAMELNDYLHFTFNPVEEYEHAYTRIALTSVGDRAPGPIYYSIDDGANWESYTLGTEIHLDQYQPTVYFRGNAIPGGSSSSYCQFTTITSENQGVYCGGYVNSLYSYPDLTPLSSAQYMFKSLFQDTAILTPPKIYQPMSSALGPYCFQDMFRGCSKLTAAPDISGDTSGAWCCCQNMFWGCTSLRVGPSIEVTKLTEACFSYMFYSCYSLVVPPKVQFTGFGGYQACFFMMSYCHNLKIYRDNVPGRKAYRIPDQLNCSSASLRDNLNNMLIYTGGDNIGTPSLNGTYYYDSGLDLETPSPMLQECKNVSEIETIECICHTSYSDTVLQWQQSRDDDTWTDISGANDEEYTPTNPQAGWTFYRLKASALGGLLVEYSRSSRLYFMPYLCITSTEGNTTIQFRKQGTISKNIYYSRNLSSWSQVELNSTTITLTNPNETIYFKGANASGFSESTSKYIYFLVTGGAAKAEGSVIALLDDGAGSTRAIPNSYCFYKLFISSTALTQAPELPSTSLQEYCYGYMFSGCTSLVNPPVLPATTLNNLCYSSMFYGCSSLITAPALPATNLTQSCYSYMFMNCTSLTTAPTLSATSIPNRAYMAMFQGCESLVTPPALPATTLNSYCYANMFSRCTAMTSVPTLPATTLYSYCYSSMFQYCSSLTSVPALPATTLASYCYEYMFSNCTGLVNITLDLSHATIESASCQAMFYQCSNMRNAPILGSMNLNTYCYRHMFYQCSALQQAPALPALTVYNESYANMFDGCVSLTSCPSLPATTLADSCYESMFKGCTGLTKPPILPATQTVYECYVGMFEGCTGLLYPADMPATTLGEYCYKYMYRGCTNLKVYINSRENYDREWKLPKEGTISSPPIYGVLDMFRDTGGDFASGTNPSYNTYYYIQSSIVITGQPQPVTAFKSEWIKPFYVLITSTVSDVQYQWQVSDDGLTGWTNVSGATDFVYLPEGSTEEKTEYYRVRLYSPSSGELRTSQAAKFEFIPIDFSKLVMNRDDEDVINRDELHDKMALGTASSAERTEWGLNKLKGSYNYTDLNRINDFLYALQKWGTSAGFYIVYPNALKRDWDKDDLITTTIISNTLANIAVIKTVFSLWIPTIVPTNIITAEQANDIEEILYQVKAVFEGSGTIRYAGDFICGGDF